MSREQCELPAGHAGLHAYGFNLEDLGGAYWPATVTWSTYRDD